MKTFKTSSFTFCKHYVYIIFECLLLLDILKQLVTTFFKNSGEKKRIDIKDFERKFYLVYVTGITFFNNLTRMSASILRIFLDSYCMTV